MRNIAFYIENSDQKEIDSSHILESNPGMGGTEYMIIIIAYLLSMRDNGLRISIYGLNKLSGIGTLEFHVVESLESAIVNAMTDGCECLIFKHHSSYINKGVFEKKNLFLKLIPWCHNIVYETDLDYYAYTPSIYKIIYVSKEQLDLYRDHKSFYKSIYIYNCVNTHGVFQRVCANPILNRKNVVTYMGSIIPVKGLHWLAEVWKDVLKEVPDAELYVIGSGKLYDNNQELGPYNIAESSYENKIMPYFSKNGMINSNIHFMGILGNEKTDILLKTKVGVPNPSGRTETFCLSSVEMQLYGASVVIGNSPGAVETTLEGRICTHKSKLAKYIVAGLKKTEFDYDSTYNYIQNKFSIESVIVEWENFFKAPQYMVADIYRLKNITYRVKFLKEILRIIKKIIPIFSKIPSVERCLLYIERRIDLKEISTY